MVRTQGKLTFLQKKSLVTWLWQNINLFFYLFSDDNILHFGTIVVCLGVRFRNYCSNVVRTFMVNPSDKMQKNYEFLHSTYEKLLEKLKVSWKKYLCQFDWMLWLVFSSFIAKELNSRCVQPFENILYISHYASPSSGDAYSDRQLTPNFELWVEIFCVPTCFRTPRKGIIIVSSISVLH